MFLLRSSSELVDLCMNFSSIQQEHVVELPNFFRFLSKNCSKYGPSNLLVFKSNIYGSPVSHQGVSVNPRCTTLSKDHPASAEKAESDMAM